MFPMDCSTAVPATRRSQGAGVSAGASWGGVRQKATAPYTLARSKLVLPIPPLPTPQKKKRQALVAEQQPGRRV